MPGPVFRGRSAAPAAQWTEGKLLDADGVGTLLVRRGVEWFAGKSATAAFRVREGVIYRGASSEPHARIQRGQVYAGNSSQALYRHHQKEELTEEKAADLYSASLREAERLLSAGARCGERVWPFPLDEDFAEDLRSDVERLKQMLVPLPGASGRGGGGGGGMGGSGDATPVRIPELMLAQGMGGASAPPGRPPGRVHSPPPPPAGPGPKLAGPPVE